MRIDVCPFCGEPLVADILEVWNDHTFMIDTCCAGQHEALSHELSAAASSSRPASGPHWMRQLYHAATGEPLRRVIDHDGTLLLDHGVCLRPIRYRDAAAFVQRHHRHVSTPPPGWKFGAGLFNGRTQIGVVMVGRPVAQKLDQLGTTLEVRRLCLDHQLPAGLHWNACSQAYGWAAREASRRGYSRIVTYNRDDESGASLIAAGWRMDRVSMGGTWSRKGRLRATGTNTGPKQRWSRALKPNPHH